MASSSKKRKTGASSSASRAGSPFDETRFTSAENQKWYEERRDKSIIKEKNVAPNVNAALEVGIELAKLGWDAVLRLPEYIYPELVKEFYANVEEKDKFSGNLIRSTVRGTAMEIRRDTIATALGCWNNGPDVDFKKSFATPNTWVMSAAAHRLNIQTEPIRMRGDQKYFADKLKPTDNVLVRLFGFNIIPRKSSRNELRHSDLYFLDVLYNGTAAERENIPLPSIFISYMLTVARSQKGKTCFGLPRVLTLLFRYFGVDFTGVPAVDLTATDTYTCRALLQIGIKKKAVAAIERGDFGQEEPAAGTEAEAAQESEDSGSSEDDEEAAEPVAGPSTTTPAVAPSTSFAPTGAFDWERFSTSLNALEMRLTGRMDVLEASVLSKMDAMEAQLVGRLNYQDEQLRFLRGETPMPPSSSFDPPSQPSALGGEAPSGASR